MLPSFNEISLLRTYYVLGTVMASANNTKNNTDSNILVQWLLTQDNFAPPGDIGQWLEIVLVVAIWVVLLASSE